MADLPHLYLVKPAMTLAEHREAMKTRTRPITQDPTGTYKRPRTNETSTT
jgi:hypothetical protein